MTVLKNFEVKLESFQVKPEVEGDVLVLRLSGTGDMVAVAPLNDCLVQVRVAMKSSNYVGLKIDICALYLLNSSCLKAIVHFIYNNLEEGPGFKIEFLVDENLSWQPRALAALKRLAPTIVTITPVATEGS